MNTAADYLDQLRARNPMLTRAATIKMTPESFLHQIRLAYERGQSDLIKSEFNASENDSAPPEFLLDILGIKR